MKSVGQVPAEIDQRLALLMTEALEEFYSYGMMCIDRITSKMDTVNENSELVLSCLATAKKYNEFQSSVIGSCVLKVL